MNWGVKTNEILDTHWIDVEALSNNVRSRSNGEDAEESEDYIVHIFFKFI